MTPPTAPPLKTLRVLSISTLFPCPQRTGFGGFVANQMKMVAELARAGEAVDLTMVNPIGLPFWPLGAREPWRSLAACPETSELGGLTVHHPRFTTIPKLGGDANPARIVKAVLPMARRLHAERAFDLVDAQFFFPDGPAAAAIAEALGVPFTVKARGADISFWGQRPRARNQMLEAGERAALLLTVSEALGHDMAALGLRKDSIRIHYTGLDHQRFHIRPRAEARAALSGLMELHLPLDVPLLICPGALIPRKGHALAIDALALLPQAHLVIAGTGPEAGALRARAALGRAAGRVHLPGQVSHEVLPVLMAACDALVLPSASEGLANVWVEALACGTPLVIPDAGGARELVKHAGAGRIAAREPAAIAAALRELLAVPPSQAEVAANAAAFSWEENARRLIALWREAAGRR